MFILLIYSFMFSLINILNRAGGLGINLATADTVILYDSDWYVSGEM